MRSKSNGVACTWVASARSSDDGLPESRKPHRVPECPGHRDREHRHRRDQVHGQVEHGLRGEPDETGDGWIGRRPGLVRSQDQSGGAGASGGQRRPAETCRCGKSSAGELKVPPLLLLPAVVADDRDTARLAHGERLDQRLERIRGPDGDDASGLVVQPGGACSYGGSERVTGEGRLPSRDRPGATHTSTSVSAGSFATRRLLYALNAGGYARQSTMVIVAARTALRMSPGMNARLSSAVCGIGMWVTHA